MNPGGAGTQRLDRGAPGRTYGSLLTRFWCLCDNIRNSER